MDCQAGGEIDGYGCWTETPVLSRLPDELIEGSTLRGNEYAWNLDAFRAAMAVGPPLGYACICGQFQFLVDDVASILRYGLSCARSILIDA